MDRQMADEEKIYVCMSPDRKRLTVFTSDRSKSYIWLFRIIPLVVTKCDPK